MKQSLFFFFVCLLMEGCKPKNAVKEYINFDSNKVNVSQVDSINISDTIIDSTTIERVDTSGLIILYPHFTTIDLVCGDIPSKSDSSVILFAEASYTEDTLKEFKHENIAGDHVSGGKRYRGYKCNSNTGAFIYYDGKWKFCYKDYSKEMDMAAKNGGAAFAQEMIIHQGKMQETVRKDNSNSQFRALCEYNGKLCIIEASQKGSFEEFKKKLASYGVSEAIYLDMGWGWNHAWYRDKDQIVELHPKKHEYCTNWITFYQQ